MSKVTLKVEIEEKDYKALIGEEVFNIWRGNEILSTVFNAIKTAKRIEECDDAVSRQAVMELLNKRYCHKEPYERKEGNTVYKGYDTYYMINFDKLKSLPSVIPKREQDEYDKDYKTLQIKLENAEIVIENLKEDLRQAREDLKDVEMR